MCDCLKKTAGVEKQQRRWYVKDKIIAETATVQTVKWFTQG